MESALANEKLYWSLFNKHWMDLTSTRHFTNPLITFLMTFQWPGPKFSSLST